MGYHGFLFFVFVAGLYSTAESSPIGQAEEVPLFPVADSSSRISETPDHQSNNDLLHMLSALKGTNGMQGLTDLYKEYSLLKGFAHFTFALSPVYSRILETAAEKNPALRVVLKAARGKVPDIKDIYNLGTNSRKKSMLNDIYQAELNDRKCRQVIKFQYNNSTLKSAVDVMYFVKLLTSRDVVLTQKLVSDVNSGDVKLTQQNLANVNLLHLLHFFFGNGRGLNTSVAMMVHGQQTSILRRGLQLVGSLDLSGLEDIKAINSGLNNDKYKVTAGEEFVTDPNVVKIIQNIDQARKLLKGRTLNDGTVLTLFADLEKEFTSLFTGVLEAASRVAHSANKQSQTAMG